MPQWVVVSAIVAGLLALVYFGGKVLSGHAADPAPLKRVYPGMYDLRAEATKMRAARQNQSTANGQ